MGDSSERLFAFRKRQIENIAREDRRNIDMLLGRRFLDLNVCSIRCILNQIDYFVSQCQVNEIVEGAYLCHYVFYGEDDGAWKKIGQAFGNLQELREITIETPYESHDHDDCDDQVLPSPDWASPDWEILARILSQVRQKVQVTIADSDKVWLLEEVRTLARAIRAHPTITRFDSGNSFSHESIDILFSALATLPALESLSLSLSAEDEITLANPESLTQLLRAPSLRTVKFILFSFTSALFQATANSLIEGTAITNLGFFNCSFSTGECADMMANGLVRNTSVTSIKVSSDDDNVLFDALTAALPMNSTLRELSYLVCDDPGGAHVDWSPICLALGKNTGLKTLSVGGFDASMDESLCTAINDGLGLNKTLESLELANAVLRDDNAALWCRTLSFLRTNKALKSLVVEIRRSDSESCLSAFRRDIVAMLEENASLESLSIQGGRRFKAEDYIALVIALQQNTTLKNLRFTFDGIVRLQLTDDEDKQIAALLKKNYALESLKDINQDNRPGDVGAILRLNAAGRRYLIEDGSSVSKGVEVLSAVRSDINCVFLHLLENPRLCDRRAVEAASDSTDNGGLTCPVNPIGKREHGRAQTEGKESRRRLT
jgi:hypothetical protein